MEFGKWAIFGCSLFIAGYLIATIQYNNNRSLTGTELIRLKEQYANIVEDLQQQLREKTVEISELQARNITSQISYEHHDLNLDSRNVKNNSSANQAQLKDWHEESDVDSVNGKQVAGGFIAIENQAVDVSWAPEFTEKLTDAFQLSDALYSLGLVTAIECKTTLCEIEFDLNAPQDFGVVFQIREAFKQTSLEQHDLVFDFLEKENKVNILVGRDDDSFVGIYQ